MGVDSPGHVTSTLQPPPRQAKVHQFNILTLVFPEGPHQICKNSVLDIAKKTP